MNQRYESAKEIYAAFGVDTETGTLVVNTNKSK